MICELTIVNHTTQPSEQYPDVLAMTRNLDSSPDFGPCSWSYPNPAYLPTAQLTQCSNRTPSRDYICCCRPHTALHPKILTLTLSRILHSSPSPYSYDSPWLSIKSFCNPHASCTHSNLMIIPITTEQTLDSNEELRSAVENCELRQWVVRVEWM